MLTRRLSLNNLLLALSSLFFLSINAQQKTEAVYANTWTSSTMMQLASLPGSAETMKELSELKKKVAARDAKWMKIIRYWDAGAPSYRWNQIGYQLAGPQLFSAPNGGNFWKSPTAWMNMAIYDAIIIARKLNSSAQRKRPYEMDPSVVAVVAKRKGSTYPCEHTLTAAAASTVLGYFFPDLKDSLTRLAKEAGESRIYAAEQYPSDVAEGWRLGEKVAKSIIALSEKYGTLDKPWTGKIPDDPKLWSGDFPVGAVTLNLKPLLMKSADQFRPGPPPDFTTEMEQLKRFKPNLMTNATAFKWASLSGLDYWTDLASQKIFENHLDNDALKAAEVYTVLHLALHDVALVIMDAKYAYWGIRPDQYDKNFKPLLGFTPPFPGYPSGHATASSVAATILGNFFPDDKVYFEMMARECADSRFYAGIHFPSDNEVGLEIGRKLGDYIVSEWKKRKGMDK